MVGQSRTSAAPKQGEGVVEARGDLLHGEPPYPRRRELYGERHPVEAVADLRHRHRVAPRDLEVRPDRPRPLREEPHCFVAGQALDVLQAAGVRQRERRHGEQHLARHAQRLPARGQYPQPWAHPQQRRRERGAGAYEVLAVVQHEERVCDTEVIHERVGGRDAGLLADP